MTELPPDNKDEILKMEDTEKVPRARNLLPTPPDGGWGWVVVLASFFIHLFADGFTYTFGIFYVHILTYYGTSKSVASGIASLLVGVTLGSGPISGTLVNLFGCRWVTIFGALLASLSIGLSIYARSVGVLYLTIGLGAGLGFGLMYLPAIISVTSYFEKRRSFATGVAVCGSGLGTFIFSPMTKKLIEWYSWRGALIVIAGLMLNCCVFGALFRPLEEEITLPENTEENEEFTKENYEKDGCPNGKIHNNDKRNITLGDIPKIKVTNSPPHSEFPRNSSHGCLNEHRTREFNRTQQELRIFSSQPLLAQTPRPTSASIFDSQGLLSQAIRRKSHSGSGLLNRGDIFYGGSLLNIKEYKDDPVGYRSSIVRINDVMPYSEDTDEEAFSCAPCCSIETRLTLGSLMNWSLLSDRVFLLFILSNFCTSIGFNAPYIFIVDRALDSNISPDSASYLLSVIGISNTVSRVVLGYISDKPWVNRLHLYNFALTVCGLGTCASIWFTTFAGQAFYAAVFGAMSGAYVGLTSVVLVDLFGMERLTNAFGVLLMFQGIASLIGPPICGALSDIFGSYDYSFILAGVMIAISGVMLFLIPCAKRAQAEVELKRMAKQYDRV